MMSILVPHISRKCQKPLVQHQGFSYDDLSAFFEHSSVFEPGGYLPKNHLLYSPGVCKSQIIKDKMGNEA